MERMTARLEETPPVRDFATAIGEWLLARRFGAITPLAFRYRVWESHEECPHEILPYVVIELLVNDPPPPSPEWRRLNEKDAMRLSLREIGEWAQGRLWPRADMDAVRDAAEAHAKEIGVPDGIDRTWPVHVVLYGRTEAQGMRFPHVAAEPAGPRAVPAR